MPKIAPSDHAKRQDCVRPSSRRAWLAGASLLALGAALAVPQQALAQNVTISTSQGGYVTPGNITFLTITNTGTLSGNDGLNDNNGYVIQTLTNNGLITANSQAVEVLASIGTLTNTGAIISSNIGVAVTGTVDSLSNSGTISGASAIHVGNTRLGALRNSGTISGSNYAIYNAGTIGSGGAGATLTNTGVIAGNIFSGSLSFGGGPPPTATTVGNNLSIAGGTGTVIGTLTGYTAGTEGTITAGNVALSGNILLNDAVSIIGSGTLTNSGSLSLISIVSITGNYSEGGTGTLSLAVGAELVVSGAATIGSPSGYGTIVSTLASGGNYFAGTSPVTLVAGGTNSSYGYIIAQSGLTGLDQSPFGTIAGNNLLAIVDNDYIGGTLASLVNSTVLGNGFVTNPVTTAVYVASTGRLGTLTNTGYLNGTAIGIANNGSIGVLTNSGKINVHTQFYTVGPTGIYNSSSGIIGALTNSGTIQGSIYAIRNAGTIGGGSVAGASFTNTGTIAGGILNTGNLSIAGATVAGSFGTLTGYAAGAEGVITNTSGNVVFTGNQLLNDTINAGANTVTNSGGSLSLISIVSITGNYTQATGTLTEAAGSELVVSGAASITGGTVAAAGGFVSTGNYLAGGAGGTLVAGGAGSNYTGVTVVLSGGTVTGLAVGSAVSGNNLLAGALNDYIGASTLASVNNTGSIGGVATAVYVASTGTLGSLTNSGALSASNYGLANYSSIGSIGNTGTITGSIYGITNKSITSSIGILSNSGTIGSPSIALSNNGTITALTNAASGSIVSSAHTALSSNGSIGTLTNSGAIRSSGSIAIRSDLGTVGTLINSGVIAGNNDGIAFGLTTSISSIGSLSNSGTISGATNAGIFNGGAIGTLSNSGTISAAKYAIYNSGNIGVLSNSSIISGVTDGIFNGGAIGTLSNSGTIAGGTYGLLNYGGSIAFLAIAAGGLIKDNVTAGLANTGSIGTIAVAGSITGQIGLANTSTITSLTIAQTGAIIGSISAINNIGSLGTVANSGIIAGNIVNTGSNDLTFTGGSGSTYGTLTGYTAGSQGTITGTTANAVFAAGQIFLNDAMNLGSHNFVNSGATIQINNVIAVTGNFVQTSGTLLIGATSATSYGDIVVTGNATITGGTVSVAGVGGFALAANQTYTIVQAHGSLSVSGLTASVTNYVPVIQTITAGGYNDLILTLNTIGSTTTGNTGGGTTTGNTVTGTTGTVTGTTGTVTGTTGTTTGTTSSGGGSGSGGSTIVATLATYTALGNATGGVATGIGPALDRITTGSTSGGGTGSNSATDQQFYTSVLVPLNALPTAAAKHTAITQLSPGQLTPQAAPIAVTPALDAITEHQNTLPGATDGLGALSRGAGAGSDGQQGALWGQLLAGNATRDQGNGAAGYGATTYGVLAGADFLVNPELLAGVAIDWITSRVTGNDALAGSNTRLSSYQFEGYGSWRPDRFDGRLTVDAQLGFGENSYNQHRAISYLNEGANAHFDGQQYVASILTGYRLDIQGPVQVAPYLRLRETHLVNGGYSETGAGLADLAVNGVTTDSFTHEIGVKAGMEFDTTYGKWFPAVKLGWIHDYTNGPIALTGNLLGGTVFTSATSQPGADGAALGLTLDLKRTDSFSLSIEYDGEYHKDFTSNTGLVNGTWKF